MTEQEWLTCDDGVALGREWGDRFTERKARLLMLACCRRHPTHLRHPVLGAGVRAVADHYADPAAPDVPLDGDAARDLYDRVMQNASGRTKYPGRGVAFGVVVLVEPAEVAAESRHSFRYLVFSCLTDISNGLKREGEGGELAAQADLVREVIGNPFRPAAVNPEWRTDTVTALARQMYASEDFSAMPILADALQDAGCDDEAVLAHCRDPHAPHARGCWVLDLVLGTA